VADTNHYGFNCIVFGASKKGKSWLGDTTPAPRVVLDAEAGSRWTPSRKMIWDPKAQAPPVPDGSWDTALVPVREYKDVLKAYEWLNSGKHPFRSVVIDSISEVQQRAIDDMVGSSAMKVQDWGQLLRVVSDLVRKFRDLVTNPIKPLDAVLLIAMAKQRNDGAWGPHIQGSLATTLPYYVDACCYLDVVVSEDGTQTRRLFCGNFPGFETGHRLPEHLLSSYIDSPNISEILARIRGEEATLPTTSSAANLAVNLSEKR